MFGKSNTKFKTEWTEKIWVTTQWLDTVNLIGPVKIFDNQPE